MIYRKTLIRSLSAILFLEVSSELLFPTINSFRNQKRRKPVNLLLLASRFSAYKKTAALNRNAPKQMTRNRNSTVCSSQFPITFPLLSYEIRSNNGLSSPYSKSIGIFFPSVISIRRSYSSIRFIIPVTVIYAPPDFLLSGSK